MIRSIPNYELYGDLLAGGLSDAVHHETIKERSSKHDWTIRLHRHRRLTQIFLFRSPGVYLQLGDVEYTSTEPVILTIPPGVPHGFLFAKDVVGDVLSIRLDEIPTAIPAKTAVLNGEMGCVFTRKKTKNFDNVVALIDQLSQAYQRIGANRTDVLTTLVHLITLYLSDDLHRQTTPAQATFTAQQDRQDKMADAFCGLIEDHFQTRWTVAQYADKVGISAPHLTRICRNVLGAPPIDLVRQRRILEAKRLLKYTRLPITEIAYRCGFREVTFFSRTFRANVGTSPKIYRNDLED